MSTSHSQRKNDAEAVRAQFAWLSKRFEHEYGRAYRRLAEDLRARYPEITKPGRRTGRALRNICFFTWCCCRHVDRKLIPALFHAAVLLSAQDDYCDNPRISAAQKELFCEAINRALRHDSFRRPVARAIQVQELTSLWSYVAGTIPQRSPQVRSYWIETACRLNDAMAAENRASRSATITYEEYMRTAIHSIGMVFVWATYLAHKHVSASVVREIAPFLCHGAMVVRLSNDMASYRQRRNNVNAVSLVGGRSPGARIRRRVEYESAEFRERLDALDMEPQVRGVLLHCVDFLQEFYRVSDFHRGPAW